MSRELRKRKAEQPAPSTPPPPAANGRTKSGSSKYNHKDEPVASPPRKQKTAKMITHPPTTTGQVWVVGSGDCGQLGLGPDVTEREKPAQVKFFEEKRPVMIAAGGLHNIVLTANNKLFSWGCNDHFALGRVTDSEGPRWDSEPGEVEGLDEAVITKIVCGDNCSAALTRDGNVYIWGTFRDSMGIFGATKETSIQKTPLKLQGLHDVMDIAAGSNHMIAITDDGKLWSWGIGEQGQLGRRLAVRQIVSSSLVPRSMTFKAPHASDKKFVGAFCGSYHTHFIPNTGRTCGVGLNQYGQIGDGSSDNTEEPVEVLAVPKVVGGAAGEHHSLFLDDQGRLWATGRNDSGQLGYTTPVSDAAGNIDPTNAQTDRSIIPHLVDFSAYGETPPKITSVSAGTFFSVALSDEETNNLYTWGYGEMGQLCNPGVDDDVLRPFRTNLNNRKVLMVSAGGQHTLMLLAPKDLEAQIQNMHVA
ncbi:hypothetical protein SmJEL517_g04468 [Synchytrium microbalum]|uniref:RCC1-like domain-containing protein n=1 Tax=Synchytrium microbalum TaxID=1806994 RepID=A0A507C4R9_9FUNG|nr:uncharacterized protein SmJEL517_g04468 [Synchytrium microbalum]TPX32425.1 hypothetical protein SmJEL517_g04468 [Synchytrium microbalum]